MTQNPLMMLLARAMQSRQSSAPVNARQSRSDPQSQPIRFEGSVYETRRMGEGPQYRETESGREELVASPYDAKVVTGDFAKALGFQQVDGAFLDSQGRNASFDVLDDGTAIATTHLGGNRYSRFRAGVDENKNLSRSQAQEFEDNSQSWKSIAKDTVRGGLPLILMMTGAGPLAAAYGGGAVGSIAAGATIGGGTAAINGGNSSQILRGALTGAATAGAGQVINPALASTLGGGTGGQAFANAITNAGVAKLRGQDPTQAALMGGLTGVSPQAARVLSSMMRLQRGFSGGQRPRPRG